MKRIQYTTEQEKKLIEMSQFLYPEYKEIHINGAWIYFNKGLTPLNTIPIFEFCIKHLQCKILGVSDYEKTKIFLMRILFQCEQPHPVDYLYEEFKKLKH